MDYWKVLISIIVAIGLFTHSLESFSSNLKEQANDKMHLALQRFIGSKLKGLLTGFIGTDIIQSSSAVVAITVSFVDSRVISFHS